MKTVSTQSIISTLLERALSVPKSKKDNNIPFCKGIYGNCANIQIKQQMRVRFVFRYIKYRVGPPFSFRTALILHGIDSTRCWKHSSEILVHIDMIASRSCCRFVGCTSMMRFSRSTTSQRCSIGLRSGDCGGHLSKINSLSCSRN